MPNQQSYPDVKDFKSATRTLAALEAKLAQLDAARTELDVELGKRQAEVKTTEVQLERAYEKFDEETVTKLEGTIQKLKAAAQRFARMLSAKGEQPERGALQQQILQAQLTVRDLHAKWWNEYEGACREKAIEWLGLACIAAQATGHTDSGTYLRSLPVQNALHAAVQAREEQDYPIPQSLAFSIDKSKRDRGPDREHARIAARDERAQREAGVHIRGHSFGIKEANG